MQVQDNTVVSINYKLTDDAGEVIDSSEGREPLAYLHGAGNIIPGLEDALVGKAQGDTLAVDVEPAQGYGEHDAALVESVSRELFQGVDEIEVGMQFQAATEHGDHVVTVTKIEDDAVTIDANHPLAGQNLHFDVTIVEVREATESELEHGHPH